MKISKQLLEACGIKQSQTITEEYLSIRHYVLTGKLSKLRSEVIRDINKAGHIVDRAVTAGTDYLVAGKGPWGTKHKKAESMNIKVITEPQLYKQLQE